MGLWWTRIIGAIAGVAVKGLRREREEERERGMVREKERG